ncbi:sensor histidine kinase [Vibrio spartinae]|uniref:histidine kinase n=1 Tax=Vibrio spartinae TaxID=1918945 RepID=A0A1N6M525_9VIBR|nr:sensor histidine kinase [Vibrio spartinae]QMV16703.1 Sensor protein QseC [Vibrio spartinae]SIO94525.1 Sensor protein QseC [Vibrio spartinae]
MFSLSSISTRSLRFQLLAYSASALLFIGLLSMLAVKRYAYQTAQYTFDRPLANAALQILEDVLLDGDELSVDLPFSAFSGLADSPRDKVFYLVTTKQKAFVTGYQALLSEKTVISQIDAHPLQLEVAPHFFDLVFKQQHVRFALVGRVINTRKGPHQVYVLVGQTTEARTDWEQQLLSVASKLIFGVVFCTIIVIVILIAQVMKPLKSINRKISKRSNVDLTPIDVQGPEEVTHLVKTINSFMFQLDETLVNLKNFTSEAAHQLKTPVAGMRSQIELMLSRESSPQTAQWLMRLLEACGILERTIEQLLNHAMIKHRFRSVEPTNNNINQLVQSICRELAINALKRNIELSYQQHGQYQIKGDEFALTQMLSNLIENAIKYSPDNSVVEVEVARRGTKAIILIRDFGVGIKDEDKPHVFKRFYRTSGNRHSGTGLGMTIAADVARTYHARLILHDTVPQGLTVEIQFPYRKWKEIQ